MASQEEKELLKSEIERLIRELDQASSEKVQSAQFGLVLLEEKKELQQKCEEFESLYENTKHDLHITKEVRFAVVATSLAFHPKTFSIPGPSKVPIKP